MTDKARPDEPEDGSGEEHDIARFLRDWTALWREEMQVLSRDPEAMLSGTSQGRMPTAALSTMDLWRPVLATWAETLNSLPVAQVRSRDGISAPRAKTAVAASDPRDAEIERLARRVDELEARLAKLEAPRRRRG